MKFEKEKVDFANSDRIECNDLQFLTFRNSAQNNTGRSVFSQKIQMYKSLQRGNQQQQYQVPIRNFKKASNLRSIRSQQKYSLSKPFTTTNQQHQINNNEQNNLEVELNQFQFRNQLLKKKIQKITKNIKNQQKKQTSLQKDIDELQKDLQDDQAELNYQLTQIQQLQTIKDENQLYLEKLSNNLSQFEKKNDHLENLAHKIEESLHNLGKTSRQEEAKSKMALKLKQGLLKLENLKQQVTARCTRIENQIHKMKDLLEQTDNLDTSIRDATYTRQTQNSSHFTC